MLTKGLVPLILVLPFAGPASAEVKSVTANGFEVATTGTIAAPSDRVYAALGEVGHWWDPSHTFSRDATNLSIELRAGGCFCERLKDGGSVQHLQVVYAAPGQGLRLRGALGPLQTEGVDGTLNWTLKPGEGGTNVTVSNPPTVISAPNIIVAERSLPLVTGAAMGTTLPTATR